MVWKQMVLKSLFFNSGQTTPTPTIQATWCLAGRGLHENVPTVLSFVCRAPFSKAAMRTHHFCEHSAERHDLNPVTRNHQTKTNWKHPTMRPAYKHQKDHSQSNCKKALELFQTRGDWGCGNRIKQRT